MNEKIALLLSFVAGLGLGVVFYGGLWLTVKKGISSNHPALWFLSSLLLRTAITMVGFYLVAEGDLSRLVLCLVGFILFRVSLTRMTRLPNNMNHEN